MSSTSAHIAAKGLLTRIRLHDAVALPGTRPIGARRAAPEVDDPSSVVPHGERGAGAALLSEDVGERLSHRLESWLDRALGGEAILAGHNSGSRLWTRLPRARGRRPAARARMKAGCVFGSAMRCMVIPAALASSPAAISMS